ncbi:heterokaryon incompatibility protein-domain-containing protein [Xylariaceae sp. FL1272]|nr:heterokaryon incompatibility protein-domain-containing protein [Xylariaceae sp. FL1272]
MVAYRIRYKKYRPPWLRQKPKSKHKCEETACFRKGLSISDDETRGCSSCRSSGSSGAMVSEQSEDENSTITEARAQQYTYANLTAKDDIRLLQLLPGQKGEALRVRIRRVSLSAETNYTAISYAWGERKALKTIFDEDRRIRIPVNLHQALESMRHPAHAIDLWADAVCIDQTNKSEKSQQVSLMRCIFKKAKKVIVWLGQDTRKCAEGLFHTLSTMAEQDFQLPPESQDSFWRGLERLFRKAWFRRLWCLQEIVLASDAYVQWGQETLPWHTIAATATMIRSSSILLLRTTPLKGANNAYLMHMLSQDLQTHKLVSFLELLALSWRFRCSDGRDSVYGLIGIPTQDSDPDAGNVLVEPDYRECEVELFRRCAIIIVEKTQSIRLLLHVQVGMVRSGYRDEYWNRLPSWVPRWNNYLYGMLAPSETTNSFAASSELPAYRPRIHNDTLLTRGITLSRISCSTEMDHTAYVGGGLPSRLVSNAWTYVASSVKYQGHDEKIEALSFILTAAKDWSGALIENKQQHIADFFASIRLIRSQERNFNNMALEELSTLMGVIQVEPDIEGGHERFDQACLNACEGRAVFLCNDGFVGLGPRQMMKGDKVCLLSGLELPIIMRRKKDGYRVVGEAYVHGIMDGEASRLSDNGTGTSLEDFTIY